MDRITGSRHTPLMECINPRRQTYAVRWDMHPVKDENGVESETEVSFMEERFNHKPTLEEIKEVIIGWYNSEIDKKILNGFIYEGAEVWLTTENQFNYKVAYDLAVQTNGANLPVTFKFGSSDKPVYKQFNTLAEISRFYTTSVAYVQNTYMFGWMNKDRIDWGYYEIN